MKINMLNARSIIRAIIERNKRPSIQFRDGSNSDPLKQFANDLVCFMVVLSAIAAMVFAMHFCR